ncbi:MAG: response regulator [Caldilineaceae bacterium]
MAELLETIAVIPVLEYPSSPVVGRTYLMRVELVAAYSHQDWPFTQEEYVLDCRVTPSHGLVVEPVGESTIIIDRFGSSFGAALFHFTATGEAAVGELGIELINEWGLLLLAKSVANIKVMQDRTAALAAEEGHKSTGRSGWSGTGLQNARVLIVEADEQWIVLYRSILDGRVAHTISVQSLEEAIVQIDSRYFNLAIVGMSLSLNDPTDRSGMEFVAAVHKRGLDKCLAVVLFAAHAVLQDAIVALRDYHVVDFINKAEFHPQSLLNALHKAMEAQQNSGSIDIRLDGNRQNTSLWEEKAWMQREDPEDLAAELRDLLHRLYPHADRLWIRPLPTAQTGAGVLEARLSDSDFLDELYIVKYGKRDKVARELRNYEEYVKPYQNSQSITEVGGVSGRVMGAIRYRLIAGDNKLTSFSDYYRRQSAINVCAALDYLFGTTCQLWYDSRELPRRYRNLVTLYTNGARIRWEEVWKASARCGIDIEQAELEFPGVNQSFVNPRHWLQMRKNDCSYLVSLAYTHGALNEHNVIVSQSRRCWLLDFYRTGKGHILRDFVTLETVLKFNLTRLNSFDDRVQFENLLLDGSRFGTWPDVRPNEPYSHAATVVAHLRSIAREVIGSEFMIEEYEVALLLQTLKHLSLDPYHSDSTSRGHVLLSAAMICSHLGLPNLEP